MTQYVVMVTHPPVPNRLTVEAVVHGPFASHHEAQTWVLGQELLRNLTLIVPLKPIRREHD